MAREWDVTKRDLLDIERQSQAERVNQCEALLRRWLHYSHKLRLAGVSDIAVLLNDTESAMDGDEHADSCNERTPQDILRNEG